MSRRDRDPNRSRREFPPFTVGEFLSAEADEVERNTCRACGKHIQMQIFRDTGYCSGLCVKAPF